MVNLIIAFVSRVISYPELIVLFWNDISSIVLSRSLSTFSFVLMYKLCILCKI
jgi:hypothetical protein